MAMTPKAPLTPAKAKNHVGSDRTPRSVMNCPCPSATFVTARRVAVVTPCLAPVWVR